MGLLAGIGDRPALVTAHGKAKFGQRASVGDVDPVDLQTIFLTVQIVERGTERTGEGHATAPARPTRRPIREPVAPDPPRAD